MLLDYNCRKSPSSSFNESMSSWTLILNHPCLNKLNARSLHYSALLSTYFTPKKTKILIYTFNNCVYYFSCFLLLPTRLNSPDFCSYKMLQMPTEKHSPSIQTSQNHRWLSGSKFLAHGLFVKTLHMLERLLQKHTHLLVHLHFPFLFYLALRFLPDY